MIKNLKSRLKRVFVQLPKLAFNLSGDSFIRGIFLYFKLVYFTFSRQSLLRGKSLMFNFLYNKTPFSIEIYDNLDTAVLVEVFALMEYEWELDSAPTTILDLGAHWGDTAIFYTLTYPEAKIVSVEPAPSSFARLVKMSKGHSKIIPVQAALTQSSGEIDLFLYDSSLGNSLTDRKHGEGEKVRVQGLTIPDLCKEISVNKFDLIKFDIEGAEEILFKLGDLRQFADAYIGEIHLDLMSLSLEDVKEVFRDFDYSLFSIGKDRYIVKAVKKS